MRIKHSLKRELYYEKAMDLYFKGGMCGTHICKILPISRTILYKWIAIFPLRKRQDHPNLYGSTGLWGECRHKRGMAAAGGHGRSRRVRADSIHFNKSDFPLRASNPDTGILGRLKHQSICKTGC